MIDDICKYLNKQMPNKWWMIKWQLKDVWKIPVQVRWYDFFKGTFEGSEQGLTLLPSDRLVIQKVKSRDHSAFLFWFQPLFCSSAGGRAQLLVHLMLRCSGDDHFSSHITFYSCSNLFDDHGNIFFFFKSWLGSQQMCFNIDTCALLQRKWNGKSLKISHCQKLK